MKNSSKLILIFAIVLMVIVMVIVIGIEGWYIFGILKKPDNNSNNINKTEKDDSMTVDNNASNDKKNESNNNNAQVAQDYSKWLGKWTDNKNNVFTVEKIENGTITFSWTLYRLATMGNITLPLNDSKAIFYRPTFEDKNYNGKQDEGELVYRKATVSLESSGVIVNVTNTTAEEANMNVTQIINSGGPYISLGKYEYTIKE